MFQIEQSTILHALGYAIGHSLWQMSLLWLLYFGAIHLAKLTSSRKYILAVGASLAGLVAFAATFIYYTNHLEIDSHDTTAFTMLKEIPAAVSSSENVLFIYNSLLATLRSLSPYLSCAYLVVMLVLSVRLVNGFGQVKQLRSQGLSKPPIDWRLFVKQHSRFLGIKKPVALYVSQLASSPLTIGFWKPVILIPVASMTQLSPQQLEAVLLHELAHIRRHDYLLNIILQMAEIALFFNPFMRLLLKQARQERENSCDDWVLQFRYNAADYARALLAIEKQSTQSLLALGTNNKNEFQLLNRVKRMLAPERQSFNYRQQLGLLFLITLLGLGFTMIVPRQQSKHQQEVRETRIETSTAQESNAIASVPIAVDLVKNLENIQKINKVVSSKEFQDKAEQIAEEAVRLSEKMITKTDIQINQQEIEKHTQAIALALEKIPFKEFEFAGLDPATFKNFQFEFAEQIASQPWYKTLEPALQETSKALAIIQGEGNILNLTHGRLMRIDAEGPTKKGKVKNEQEKANAERQRVHVYRMSKALQKLQDSLVLVQRDLQRNGRDYTVALEKAQKEIAIAPFRISEPAGNKAGVNTYYNYNYQVSTPVWNEEQTVWQNSADNPSRIARAYAKKKPGKDDDDNCTCYTPQTTQNTKTVITINGRAISEKVKKMIRNAQSELGEEWTADLQLQIEQELKKELKQLENLTIKTHVIPGTGNNNKAFVIEIDSNK
jgi:bla regulator protein BlaR1